MLTTNCHCTRWLEPNVEIACEIRLFQPRTTLTLALFPECLGMADSRWLQHGTGDGRSSYAESKTSATIKGEVKGWTCWTSAVGPERCQRNAVSWDLRWFEYTKVGSFDDVCNFCIEYHQWESWIWFARASLDVAHWWGISLRRWCSSTGVPVIALAKATLLPQEEPIIKPVPSIFFFLSLFLFLFSFRLSVCQAFDLSVSLSLSLSTFRLGWCMELSQH